MSDVVIPQSLVKRALEDPAFQGILNTPYAHGEAYRFLYHMAAAMAEDPPPAIILRRE